MSRFLSFLTMGLLALTAACSTTQRAKTEKAIADVLISEEDEAKLGAQIKQELDAQGVKYVTDPTVVAYVQGLLNRLTPAVQKDWKGKLKLYVIDDPKMVNASGWKSGESAHVADERTNVPSSGVRNVIAA